MKTQVTLTDRRFGNAEPKNVEQNLIKGALGVFKKTYGIIGLIMITILISNPIYAQEDSTSLDDSFVVKGIVSDDMGLLSDVNVTLKGSEVGTTTDKKGAFTFPKALKPNDILVFNYLGYQTQEIKIEKGMTFIKIALNNEVIEILGALEVDKPYKTKRKL